MTAEVNSAAAACPVHHDKAKAKPKASDDVSKQRDSCGFGAEMMRVASHAGGWRVDASAFDPRLSTSRVVSSIPKGDVTPAHQSGTQANWEYPSEDMYYKAMKRKGWDPDAAQMKTIVAIHNSVNEQSWQEVLKWESFHPANDPPKLKRFLGKPTEYSPKARIMNALGWSVLPFDRHDWVVDRDGKEVRYVIDFYSGQPEPGRPLSVYLDVRPALDSVEGALDRLRWQFHEKIRPLLPFEGGSLFRRDNSPPASAPSSNEAAGNSKVTPRSE